MDRPGVLSPEAQERARQITWYHTMELAPGFVTEGFFDLRTHVERYGLPEDMSGMKAIDVATFNGFWAFEMEARGAEVVALDLAGPEELDWPAFRPREPVETPLDAGFEIAKEAYGSKVERVEGNVYDADPNDLGTFDLVFCGSLLIHLRDQFGALERLHGLLKPGGTFISAEEYDVKLTRLGLRAASYRAHEQTYPVFWRPSIGAWAMMIEACGFTDARAVDRFALRPSGGGPPVRHVVHHATRR